MVCTYSIDMEHTNYVACLPYLILIGDLFIGEVGNCHLVVGGLSDLMFRPFAGLASVEEVS